MNKERIKKALKDLGQPVFGVAVQAFGRIGLEDYFPNYKIVCLSYSPEIEEMRRRGVAVFCLEEHLGKPPKGKRNPTTLLKHKAARQFIRENAKGRRPVLVLYKSSSKIEKLARKNNWIVGANPYRLRKRLENKAFFRKILKEVGIKGIEGEIMRFGSLDYDELSQKYPGKFVLQSVDSGGGKGTGFISSREEFRATLDKFKEDFELKAKNEVIVSRFIEGYSPSVTGCVTKEGVLQLAPQLQLIDIEDLHPEVKGSGVFCGHDWLEAARIPKKAVEQMELVTKKIGNYLKEESYQGIFGIDFLVDEKTGEAFGVELNPRLLGAYPVSTLVQIKKGEIPLMCFHLWEFIREAENKTGLEVKPDELNEVYQEQKKGAHFFVAAPFKPCILTNNLMAGVYRLQGEKLQFLRPGYRLDHLESEEEFLLVDGVPYKKGKVMGEGPLRIMRVVTLGKISQNMGRELNNFGKKIVEGGYSALKIKPVSK